MKQTIADPAFLFVFPEITALGRTAVERRSALERIAAATPPFEIASIRPSQFSGTTVGAEPSVTAPTSNASSAASDDIHLMPIPDGGDVARSIARAVAVIEESVDRRRVVPFFFRTDDAPPGPRRRGIPPWPSYGGLLPNVPLDGELIPLMRRLVRCAQPHRWMHYLAVENSCLLNVDWGADVAARRFSRPSIAAPSPRRALIVAIEGSDGVGKSTHVAALTEALSARGLIAKKKKMYRHGVFHDTVTKMTQRTVGNENLHLWRIERTAKIFDSVKYFHNSVAPDLDSCDVLVFDRYVETHAAAAVGRCHYDPAAMELLDIYPKADIAFLLDAPAELAVARIDRRGEKTVDEHPYMIERYRHAFLGMARRRGFVVLDATAPFEKNQATILRTVEARLERR